VFNATYNNISKGIGVTGKCACGGWGGKGGEGGCGIGQGLGVDRKVCMRGGGGASFRSGPESVHAGVEVRQVLAVDRKVYMRGWRWSKV